MSTTKSSRLPKHPCCIDLFEKDIPPVQFKVDTFETVTKTVVNKSTGAMTYVPVVQRYINPNKGLKFRDFDIETLLITGQLENLRPVGTVKMSPIDKTEVLTSSAASAFLEQFDNDDNFVLESNSEPAPVLSSEPSPEPASKA